VSQRKILNMLLRMGYIFCLVCLVCSPLFAQSATITWTNTHQTMDGFGAEDWISVGMGYNFTPAQADMFFSPTAGIGLEYIRTGNYGCPETGSCSVSTSSVPDLAGLQAAVARGAKIEIHMAPPANLQYGGDFYHGTPDPSTGNCIDQSNWTAFANYTVQWIEMLDSNGAPVSVLAIANEPNMNQTNSLGGCVWTASGLDSYISGYLGPAMNSAGLLNSVRIAMPDVSVWFDNDFVSTCMNDSSCKQYVSIAEGHDYDLGGGSYFGTGYCCHAASGPPSSTAGESIWMDEVNGGFNYNSSASLWVWDPSMSDALEWAQNINDFLAGPNVSAWFYWELADCCAAAPGAPFNDGLTDSNFNTSKRFYVVGNWSRYVRSGWVRIDATQAPVNGIYITAFRDQSSQNFAIIAVNQNASPVNLTFSLAGFPSVTSVTPTLTSANASLADQPTVAVSAGAFSYSMPSESVVTFHGTASSSSQAPLPPGNLTATVQ
jgi:glucuronoarabinoxylan endo-1,4-beta-xylanase